MSQPSPESLLDEILSEPLGEVKAREANAFDHASGPIGTPVVIVGAGGLGRIVYQGLRHAGVAVAAFTDNNPSLWTETIDSVPILEPSLAAGKFSRDAVFVISVWNPARTANPAKLQRQFTLLGCRRVVPFTWLFWRHPSIFLPYYLWDLPSNMHEQGSLVHRTLSLFDDRDSKCEFVRQVKLRSTGDFSVLMEPCSEPQYFAAELQPNLAECFVDCGAYRGDTLEAFLDWCGGAFHEAIAFESDPKSYRALQDFIQSRPDLTGRTAAYPYAVSDKAGPIRFAATGRGNGAVMESGGIEVESVKLDSIIGDERATFIKMDIEGSEIHALEGARQIVRRSNPVLAICAYHQQSHLWEVPMKIGELMPPSRRILRQYCPGGLDLVCYAIPEHRLAEKFSL